MKVTWLPPTQPEALVVAGLRVAVTDPVTRVLQLALAQALIVMASGLQVRALPLWSNSK
ncbi:hypothetical protein D3C76_1794180 [compost metagenome]